MECLIVLFFLTISFRNTASEIKDLNVILLHDFREFDDVIAQNFQELLAKF